ncbi:MAG: thiol peroxidase [Candidatus Omnitrophica bacterium]|nr:thiol peroxidase [Candidatus Omnitrophota bacterium]
MTEERRGVVTFKGNPLTLVGPEIKAGDKAPDFSVLAGDLSEVKLANLAGKTVLISVVPSLDTPICDLQSKRFNEEASKLPENIKVVTVSIDLPFAQKRWCGAAHADKIQCLSDHREASFGQAFGVLIKELRLLARSIFILDPQGTVTYAEYVKEVTEHPDYDKALAVLKSGASV